MGLFDDPIGPSPIAPQKQKGNAFIDALMRAGDVLSRPFYGLGNAFEATSYQLNQLGRKAFDQPLTEGDVRHKEMVGDTNPLTAIWEGLSGKDKTGIGEAIGKTAVAYDPDRSRFATKLLSNPVTAFGANLATDPLAAVGALGTGGRATQALQGLGKSDDAGALAKIAGRLVTPERLQNIDIATQAAGTNPAAVLPGAAIIGMARKFAPQADEAAQRFFTTGGKAAQGADEFVDPAAQSMMLEALGKVGIDTPEGLMSQAVANSGAAQRGIQGIGSADIPVELTRPRPVVPPALAGGNLNVPPTAPISGFPSSLPGQLPDAPMLPSGPQMGGALPSGMSPMGELPRGAIPGAAAIPEAAQLRAGALQKALGGATSKNAILSPEMRAAIASSSGRGATGSFLSKAVRQDARQLQDLLNDPETRVQTLKMLQELVGG